MNPLSKLSFFLLALGFFVAPFFASAVFPTSNFQLPIPNLSGFSLKDLDTRIYARLQGEGGEITQTAGHLCTTTRKCLGGGWYRYCFDTYDCPEQCEDGHDNDGDDLTDYPADPGCTGQNDSDETNPAIAIIVGGPGGGADKVGGGGVKECNDGIDNDGDSPDGVMSIDYAPGGLLSTGDTDCDDLTDNKEGPSSPLNPIVAMQDFTPSLGPTYNLAVTLSNDSNLIVDAYNTTYPINWRVRDGCGCASVPTGWWEWDDDDVGAGINDDIQNVAITTPGSVTYTLTCNKYPSCTAAAGQDSDSVTIAPQWSPSVSLSGPASVTAIQSVQLTLSATDIKTCARSWTGGTLILSGGNPQIININAGTISAPATFTVNCIGFNDSSYQASAPVGFISGPTPYFFINSINLIIIGPGSGGRSNKATIGITPGGGFMGTINLSAANSALTSAGAVLHIEPSTITCDGVSCTTAEFWVETAGDLAEAVYNITLTADPVPSGFESKTQDIPLRVRRFIPAFEEI